MEAKKISFGFSKINKKTNFLPTKSIKSETKVELIKCLEDHEIKLVKEKPEEQLLIIPLKESQKTSAALASLMKRRAVLLDEEESEEFNEHSKETSVSTNNQGAEENIETRAARELLAEIRKENPSGPSNNLVLPVVKPEDLPLEGAKEPTLDDYETIPIQEFGKALLRGMGWTEPLPNANKKSNTPKDSTPIVRPKGMGLGADKALKKKPLLVDPEPNEQLEVKRNAYVIILGGKYKGRYGQIEGFDDHAGRVIVKMAIGGAKEVFNEFLCQPVSRKEYAEYGKRINTIEYEKYKKNENSYLQVSFDKEKDKNKEKPDYSVESKFQKNYDDRRKEDYREDNKNFKTNHNEYSGQGHDNINIKNENKNFNKVSSSRKETTKYEYRDYRSESNRDNNKHQRNQYDNRDAKEQERDNENYSQRENERIRKYATKDYKQSKTKGYENSSNRNRDKQMQKGIYIDCSDRSKHETTELDDSNGSEKYSYLSNDKKSTKKSLKSKSRSKKSKSRYKNLSDTEISSMESSSDSEEEKNYKKSRKSKKSRRSSRSRERRT